MQVTEGQQVDSNPCCMPASDMYVFFWVIKVTAHKGLTELLQAAVQLLMPLYKQQYHSYAV